MGKRDGYEPGTFSWVDLSTGDADGARAFYGGLLGWEFEVHEFPGAGGYTMCHLRGDAVAAIVEEDQQPGRWNNYVSVESADETAVKAKELGATVFEEPFDVMDSGRMAVIADPGGAVFCVWEPGGHIGAGRVNDAGCMAWNELQTRDPGTAGGFYSELFDWKLEPIEQDGATVYVTVKNSVGWMNGGFMPTDERWGDAPSFWLAYFTVPSCERAVERAKESGGGLLAGPMEPGMGKIAVLNDPQGAVFAVFEGETDD